MHGQGLSTLVVRLSLPLPPYASSEDIAVVMCVGSGEVIEGWKEEWTK